ncbi:MAG TPA: S41 family peptidase [Vicinamibacterales bacterium]|nr:S41 family peptidase [Vicinamibacterales bacterium]
MSRLSRVAAALAVALGAATLSADVPKGIETFDAAWKIVRDTHFDKTFNGVDWDAVRTEFRPKAEAAVSVGELRGVIGAMLSRLGQSHFAIVPASPDETAPASGGTAPGRDTSADTGFDVRLMGRDVIVTAVEPGRGAAAAGVRPGWRLVAIGDTQVGDFLKAVPDSTNDRLRGLQAWRLMQARLRGSDTSTADLSFEDAAGRLVTRSVERQAEKGLPVKVGSLPTMFVRVTDAEKKTPAGRRAGLIAFNVWMAQVDAPFARAVDKYRAADGMVIDLRGNPGGLAAMMMGLSGHFVAERKPLGIMKTRDNELKFVANPRTVDASGQPVAVYGGPVAILVDGMSGSASECFAGGMQSIGRVRVFGQTTMGQALPALFDKLPNGDVMIHAYGDFVTADGTRLEGRGVVPDEPTPLAREDLLEGRDRALEAALSWIDRSAERGKSR